VPKKKENDLQTPFEECMRLESCHEKAVYGGRKAKVSGDLSCWGERNSRGESNLFSLIAGSDPEKTRPRSIRKGRGHAVRTGVWVGNQ